MFSVIIPAYNESAGIARAVAGVERLLPAAEGEIIVADAGPGEGTARALTGSRAVRIACAKGRAVQMNAGAGKASGSVLVFLHADTRLPDNAFSAIGKALASGEYCAGAFRLKIASGNPWLKFVAFTANVRNFFTGTPYGDQAIFVSRSAFEEAGGYREIPIMEDPDLVERLRARGGRIAILEEFAETSPRRWETEGLFLATFMHNLLRLLRLAGASPEKLAAFRQAAGPAAKLKVLLERP